MEWQYRQQRTITNFPWEYSDMTPATRFSAALLVAAMFFTAAANADHYGRYLTY